MRKYALVLCTALSISMSSCLKDTDQLDPSGTNNVIEFLNVDLIASPITSTYPLYNVSYDITPAASLELTVNYSGANVAPQDITVAVAPSPEALTTYNTENGTTYTLLPEAMYSIANTTVVIPKGQKKATVNVTFKTDQFDLTKRYAIPVKITSASYGTISGNFSTNIFAVVAKNKYDGVYTLRSRQGAVNDRAFSTTPYTWPYEVSLITTGPNSVVLHNTQYANDYTHPLQTLTGWSRLGSYTPVFTFDPGTGALTGAANYYTAPTNGRGGKVNPAVTTSRYDAAAKTVYAAILMSQPGFTDYPFYDTLVFKRAR